MDSVGAHTQSRRVINYQSTMSGNNSFSVNSHSSTTRCRDRSTMSGNNSFSVNSHSSTTRCREDFNADVQVLKYGALLSLSNYTKLYAK